MGRFGKTANKGIRMFFDEIEKFLKKTSTQGKMKNAFRFKKTGSQALLATDWNENIITKFNVETVIFNKKKLAVNYSMKDDILNRLLPDSGVASDRPPVNPFLEKLRKKVGSIMLVPDGDFEQRIKELVDTANMMNKRNK